jgi:NAD(P)-dependent dehydrogenase (short-subunit alcohol dehydrogenase family)
MINRTIVVTGASRGIGKETVLLLASDTKNTVIALSRDLDLMQQNFAHLSNVNSHRFDLNEAILPQAERIFSTISEVSILINNAGYLIKKPFKELTQPDFQKSLQVNFLGPVELIQFLTSRMAVKGAHVVNISTMGAFQGSSKFPELIAYASSKTALCNFTEVYAEENKDGNIRMNCLCLGAVQTEMLAEAFPGYLANTTPKEMASFVGDFALNKGPFFNGKIIPVSNSTP